MKLKFLAHSSEGKVVVEKSRNCTSIVMLRPPVKGVRSTDINILEEFDLLLITLSFDLAQNPVSD